MKAPRTWRKKNGAGKYVGNCFVSIKGTDVNLGTKNHVLAQQRMREAITNGKRNFLEDADAAAAALDPDVGAAGATDPPTNSAPAAAFPPSPPPAAPAAPAPTASPAGVQPDAVLTPGSPPLLLTSGDAGAGAGGAGAAADARAEAEATNAAAAEGASDDAGAGGAAAAADAARKQELTQKELAKLGVEAQIWGAAFYARRKVWKGFITPTVPEVAKAPLVEQWEKILEYSGAAVQLPPWVTGLVIPGATLLMATGAMASAFAELAAEQKAANDNGQGNRGDGAAAAAAAA